MARDVKCERRMPYVQWMMLAATFSIGCGGNGDQCRTDLRVASSLFPLDEADGGSADLAGVSCTSICQSHGGASPVLSCNFVPLDAGSGVICDYDQLTTLCP